MGSRPLLILHGTNDRQVPSDDARYLAEAHQSPELRLVNGADHRIRHDPRAIAVFAWVAGTASRGEPRLISNLPFGNQHCWNYSNYSLIVLVDEFHGELQKS